MYLVQNPTFVNPDSFNSVDDLRRELHRANATLTKYWTAIEQRDIAGREFIALVHSLLMQHVRGDHRGVAAILDAHRLGLTVAERVGDAAYRRLQHG